MKEIQWRDSTPESVRQTGTPSAAKENLRLHGVAYTPMTANKHTILFDGGVVKQVTTPLQVVADDDTQEVQLLYLYRSCRFGAAADAGRNSRKNSAGIFWTGGTAVQFCSHPS